MQIFENKDITLDLYQRALSLAISKEFLMEQTGHNSVLDSKQDSEQANRRRELLAVEEKANKDKVIEQHGQNHYRTQVMKKFYAKVNKRINAEFDNKEVLYSKTILINDAIPALLDLLSVRAASIKRLGPLVNSLPWLGTELVNLVNKPQYRKRADVQVSNAKLALSYVGLDNLKLVVPTFVLKHWLPHSTAPYQTMKRKLWNDSLAVGLAAQALAQAQNIDPFRAFATAMLSSMGTFVVTQCFLNSYNEMHAAALKKAFDNQDKKLHDALLSIKASPDLLLEQLISRSAKITAEMAEKMAFERLPVTEAMFDLAYGQDIKKMSPLAHIILKAKAYVMFRSLAKEEAITSQEAKSLLASVKLMPDEIALLKKTDVDHLKLNFN